MPPKTWLKAFPVAIMTSDVVLPIELTSIPSALERPERPSFVAIQIDFTNEVPALLAAEMVAVKVNVIPSRRVSMVSMVTVKLADNIAGAFVRICL